MLIKALALSPSSSSGPPEYANVAGQRCLLVPNKSRNNFNANAQKPPPLVVCVGTAQTAASWEHHFVVQPPLSFGRDVLIYQAAGLGLNFQTNTDVSLRTQAAKLVAAIRIAFPDTVADGGATVDLAGFSLGGRIAMAVACEYPDMIRKLHLTGVSLERSDFGHLQLMAWRDHLRCNNLRAFSWSAVLASYSPAFLRRNELRLPTWIEQGVCENHTTAGLLALFEQAHDETGPWSVSGMAERLANSANNNSKRKGQLLVGEYDLMSPVEHVEALAAVLKWDAPTVIPSAGHCVPMEEPRAWREHLLQYLNDAAIDD